MFDASHTKACDETLKTCEDYMRRAYEASPIMAHITDFSGQILMVSDYWLSILGFSRDEVINQPFISFVAEKDRAYFASEDYLKHVVSSDLQNIPVQLTSKNGTIIHAIFSAVFQPNHLQTSHHIIAVLKEASYLYWPKTDNTDQGIAKQLMVSNEMIFCTRLDALTGLLNRAEFERQLERILSRAHKEHNNHVLMYIDLNQFKLINDACGNSAGDELLQRIAHLITKQVRPQDTIARIGGDEFGVVFEDTQMDTANSVAKNIVKQVEDFRFIHHEQSFRINVSIGLVPLDSRWATISSIMQIADMSCFAAKEEGLNRVHAWYDCDIATHQRHDEMQWATKIEQALDRDTFVLYGQQIFPIHYNESQLHAEVLIRLLGNEGEIILPGIFLPAAVRFHFSSRIDCWVIKKTIELLRLQTNLLAIKRLNVNLSGNAIGEQAFHQQVVDALDKAGPEICNRLCFEITETSAITNMKNAILFIEKVRELGVTISLDDFGSGASTFSYLKHLKIDMLKIDGQFIQNMINSPIDNVSVRCFVEISKVVGSQTIAEFVDKPDILHHLKKLGVDYAQGFLLHKPELLDNLIQKHVQ